jgi:hypothetical protein
MSGYAPETGRRAGSNRRVELWQATLSQFFEAVGAGLPLPPGYARSLRRIHVSRWVSTRGVWQKPKYPRHPRRYGARSSITCSRLFPRVRRVTSRICALNLASAFGAMRRSLPSFAMLNPRNLRSSDRYGNAPGDPALEPVEERLAGRATALFASLTFSFRPRRRTIRNGSSCPKADLGQGAPEKRVGWNGRQSLLSVRREHRAIAGGGARCRLVGLRQEGFEQVIPASEPLSLRLSLVAVLAASLGLWSLIW